MNLTQVFPIIVGVMEFGAAVVYLWNHEPLKALIWFAYGVSAVTLAFLK